VSENDKEEAEAEMQKKYGTRKHSKPLRRRQPRKYAPTYDDFDTTMAQFDQPMGMLFMAEQMSLERGLKLPQGSPYKRQRAQIMNLSEDLPALPTITTSTSSQDCVGTSSCYADVA
jgi:hypothetical protein